MKRPAKLLGILMALPIAGTLMLSAAAPSLADNSECRSVLLGILKDCSNNGNKPSDPPKNTAAPTRPAKAPVAPSPVAPAKATSAPVVTPKKSVTPSPQPTVTIVEKTKEVIVTKQVIVTQSSAPSQVTLPAPADTPTATPTQTVAPAAVAPKTSATPTNEQFIIEGRRAADAAGSFITDNAGSAGLYLFFIGIAGITVMLTIAKIKKLFPFEKGAHRP